MDMRASQQAMREGIKPLVQPAHAMLFLAPGNIRHVYMDGFALPDTVEASNALFDGLGVSGKVPEDHVVGALKVSSLAADFRADQQLCTVLLAEPCRAPVAGD